METTYNEAANDFGHQVQAMICMSAFERLCAKVKGQFRLVPLKGIDLVRFLYSDTLDRELRDLDILVVPAEKAMDFIGMLQQEGYRAEYSFSLDKAAMHEKKKVSMVSGSERLPDVDVHLALLHKKFFSNTINGFNQDALSRIKDTDDVISVLDDVDRWMYLAAHLTFHYLEGEKWYRDLALLLERFDDSQIQILMNRSRQYNFERIVGAVCFRMQSTYPKVVERVPFQQLLPGKKGRKFITYIIYMAAHPKRLGHGFHLVRYYWEFVFISKRSDWRRSIGKLFFPSLGNMQNIYRCHAALAVLCYIPNVIINAIGFIPFTLQYLLISQRRHE